MIPFLSCTSVPDVGELTHRSLHSSVICEVICEVSCDFFWTGIPRGRPPWASPSALPPSRPTCGAGQKEAPLCPLVPPSHTTFGATHTSAASPGGSLPPVSCTGDSRTTRGGVHKKKLRRWLHRSSAGPISSSVLSTTFLSWAARGTFPRHRAACPVVPRPWSVLCGTLHKKGSWTQPAIK